MWRLTPTPQINHHDATSKSKKRTEVRRTERQRKGKLADLAVEAVTLGRYQQTLWNFFCYLDVCRKPLPCTVWRLDDELSQYVEELWAAGDGLTQTDYTLAVLHHFAPQLHGRIPGAWKKLKNLEAARDASACTANPSSGGPEYRRYGMGARASGRRTCHFDRLSLYASRLRSVGAQIYVTVCTLVMQLCSTSVSPRQDQEKVPESKSQS